MILANLMQGVNAANIVDFLEDVFIRRGSEEYLGEPVTMTQHMLQGATLAYRQGKNDNVIAAVLLHDIGHFISEFGTFSMLDHHDRHHEDAGAAVLAAYFPEEVVACVKHHVRAKRYLCATDKNYFGRLSDASVHSLMLQGGPMSQTEVDDFSKQRYLKQIIQVRNLDDAGKDPEMNIYDFVFFKPLLNRLVRLHTG